MRLAQGHSPAGEKQQTSLFPQMNTVCIHFHVFLGASLGISIQIVRILPPSVAPSRPEDVWQLQTPRSDLLQTPPKLGPRAPETPRETALVVRHRFTFGPPSSSRRTSSTEATGPIRWPNAWSLPGATCVTSRQTTSTVGVREKKG